MPFTDAAWDAAAVERNLNPSDYCRVCVFDLNESGSEKTKANCKGPIRATPGGPINLRAMAALAGAIAGGRGGISVPAAEKRRGARYLVARYREADRTPPPALLRAAGMRQE